KKYWQVNEEGEPRLLHFIGKDNIVFHCLMFPAMLMAHGDYVLPENVPANEFLNLEGDKLSTSRNWAVWLHEYLEEFPPDLLRYALATTLPETKDADFSWKDFQSRVNSELADVLGNFVHRSLTFANRFFDGVVPPLANPSDMDRETLAALAEFPDRIGKSYDAYRFREGVFESMALARLGNKYFNDTEPWKTRNADPQACANTVHVSLQLCASLAVLLDPVLPQTAASLRGMLNLEGVRTGMPGAEGAIGWQDASKPLLRAGAPVNNPEILFTKIEDEVIEAQIAKLGTADEEQEDETPYEPGGDVIAFDDFLKLDLRAGVILSAEPVPKSKKLLKLQVDLGFETRQILSGVAQHWTPEELVGRTVSVVANLAPRKMMGFESQGMVLMSEDRDGKLHLVESTGEPGGVIR
ncbi:MAG: methionine--tRNA ligase subunit beta, partial [Rhodothermales bacterium]|nr:methionine--tRNA ligase subunit beta [Rhodothermales bacterium]